MEELSKEEEELLFKDLSQRLRHKVKCNVYNRIGTLTGLNDYGAEIDYGNGEDTTCEIQYCHPYLRPMSSMTEEEHKEYEQWLPDGYCIDTFDWLNAHHFAYRTINGKNMFELGLAIEVTENNNPYK